jgi:hypothetical protein
MFQRAKPRKGPAVIASLTADFCIPNSAFPLCHSHHAPAPPGGRLFNARVHQGSRTLHRIPKMLLTTISMVLAIGSAPPCSGESTRLENLMKACSEQVDTALSKISDPQNRCLVLEFDASNLAGVDNFDAVRLLNHAWAIGIASPSSCGLELASTVRTMLLINPEKWKQLVPQLPEGYRSWFSNHVSATDTFQSTFGRTLQLCNQSLALGVRCLKSAQNVDIAEVAANVVQNLPPKDQQSFAEQFPILKEKNPKVYWLATHPNPSGEQLDKGVGEMTSEDDRLALMLLPVKVFQSSQPLKAARIARLICDESMKQANLYYLALPDFPLSDTPAVRKFLQDRMKWADDFSKMELVAAWSNLDIDEAGKVLREIVAANPRAIYGPHNKTLACGYDTYLQNLAKVDPEEAALKLDEVKFFPNSMMNFVYAEKIIGELWATHESQTRRFCLTPTTWQVYLGKRAGATVDFLKARNDLFQRPATYYESLKGLVAQYPQSDDSLIADPQPVFQKVCGIVAQSSDDEVLRPASLVTDPESRSNLISNSVDSARKLQFPSQWRLLQEASVSRRPSKILSVAA